MNNNKGKRTSCSTGYQYYHQPDELHANFTTGVQYTKLNTTFPPPHCHGSTYRNQPAGGGIRVERSYQLGPQLGRQLGSTTRVPCYQGTRVPGYPEDTK
eukprot:445644-Rhodomonas_salina.1